MSNKQDIRHFLTVDGSFTTSLMLDRVRMERARQRMLLKAGKIQFDMASPHTLNNHKLPVLVEEIGEVAREIQNWLDPKNESPMKCARRMQTELIQVAAVAVAWAEALDEMTK